MSVADIFAVLYSDILKINKKKIQDENRDRLILSKGHACLALYSALAQKNYFKKDLETFESDNSNLLGHPMNKSIGIEFSTGSLGMGLSLGIGVAIAAKKKRKSLKYLLF